MLEQTAHEIISIVIHYRFMLNCLPKAVTKDTLSASDCSKSGLAVGLYD